jgi:hypothetical protein
MKVKLNGTVEGELLSGLDRAHFTSNDRKTRLVIESAKITISGIEDDNCIWIRGLEDMGEKMFKRVDYSFYPLITA